MEKSLKDKSPIHQRIVTILKNIPKGKVVTYGRASALAGVPRGARQVSWILNSSTQKYNLPWQRVIGSGGKIAIPGDRGYLEQKRLLLQEGIEFSESDKINLDCFQWDPPKSTLKKLLKGLPDYIPSKAR